MHFARIVKFAFIFIAAGLTFFLLSQNNDQIERVDIPTTQPINAQLKKTKVTDVASTIMKSPRFSGEDNKNRKWLVVANQAIQSGNLGNEEVILDSVKATITTAKGENLLFDATEGLFSRTTESLVLQKGLKITGLGFIIKTQKITASLRHGTVSGENEVTVTTKQGNLTAGNFNINQNAQQVIFSGGVSGTFNLRGKQ